MITVEFNKNISEIPARFRWTSSRIWKKNSLQNSTGKFGQISRRNSTGTPPEYHWNYLGLTTKKPARFWRISNQKSPEIYRNTAEIPPEIRTNFPALFHRNTSGITVEFRTYQPEPAGFRRKFRWHSGAFFS